LADITTVTFDLWQTLLVDERDLGQARAEVRLEGAKSALAKFGKKFGLEHIREAYMSCFQQCRDVRDGGLDVDFREQVSIFVNHIEPGLAEQLTPRVMDEVAEFYSDSFLTHPPPAHSDAVQVLQGIKDMGLKMGLISNTGMTLKLAKPGREIFMMTLRAMDATPQQTIHVGDHVLNDVVGAKRCGLKTIWITGFYEREDPDDAETEPDITVSGLGEVVEAVAKLAGRVAPN